jgi:hypothetical protein
VCLAARNFSGARASCLVLSSLLAADPSRDKQRDRLLLPARLALAVPVPILVLLVGIAREHGRRLADLYMPIAFLSCISLRRQKVAAALFVDRRRRRGHHGSFLRRHGLCAAVR